MTPIDHQNNGAIKVSENAFHIDFTLIIVFFAYLESIYGIFCEKNPTDLFPSIRRAKSMELTKCTSAETW